VRAYPVRRGGCEDFCAGLTATEALALWLTFPAVPLTVMLALAMAAVLVAVKDTFWCAPDATVKVEGVAVTPAGRPVMLTFTDEADPPTLTVVLEEEPGFTEMKVGCTAMEKSTTGPLPGGVVPPPPPQPESNSVHRAHEHNTRYQPDLVITPGI
jgi:hypothetical protein